MLAIPRNADYSAQYERFGNGDHPPCIVCGRAITRPRYWCRTWEGYYVVTEAEVPSLSPMGDTGCYPLGTDCYRAHPELQPYVLTGM